jgi:hypothetical protein
MEAQVFVIPTQDSRGRGFFQDTWMLSENPHLPFYGLTAVGFLLKLLDNDEGHFV